MNTLPTIATLPNHYPSLMLEEKYTHRSKTLLNKFAVLNNDSDFLKFQKFFEKPLITDNENLLSKAQMYEKHLVSPTMNNRILLFSMEQG